KRDDALPRARKSGGGGTAAQKAHVVPSPGCEFHIVVFYRYLEHNALIRRQASERVLRRWKSNNRIDARNDEPARGAYGARCNEGLESQFLDTQPIRHLAHHVGVFPHEAQVSRVARVPLIL